MTNNVNALLFVGIVLVLLSLLISITSASDDSSKLISYRDISKPIPGVPEHPMMHVTREVAMQHHQIRAESPKAQGFLPPQMQEPSYKPVGSADLLQYYAYNPETRNQGTCGNCWVWAGTASAAIQHGVKNGINDDLSVQLFNSYYNGGGSETINGACCGGFMDNFTTTYRDIGFFIPLTNKGAGYYDGATTSCICNHSIDEIEITPNYPIDTITFGVVDTSSSNEEAILNIKKMLDSRYPVDFSSYFTPEEYIGFNNFWSLYSDEYLFQWGGVEENRTNAGGHEMLIVGYEDDTDLPYWTVLNSWGIADGNRTQGTFRMPQNIDYVNSYVNIGGERYSQFAFDVVDVNFDTSVPVPTVTPDPSLPLTADFTADKTNGYIPLFVNFTDTSTGTPSQWEWSFGDGSYSSEKSPTHLYMIPGKFNTTLTVRRGSLEATKDYPVTISVKPPYQELQPFPDGKGGSYLVPTDPDNDGLYEDVNGNGWLEYDDVRVFFEQILFAMKNEPEKLFDFDSNGFIGFGDVMELYGMI